MRRTTSPDLLSLLPIDREAAAPLHQQLFDRIRAAIVEGQLRAGQRVPATRVLALELGVSRLTVLSAYEQLLHEGYLEARVGSGTFVRGVLPDDSLQPATLSAGARKRQGLTARGGIDRAGRDDISRPRDQRDLRPFRVSLPALDAFPRTSWAQTVGRHARTLSAGHMGYNAPAGLGVLRSAIAAHLRTARAVRCEASQVLVVSGSQAALRLCAAVLLDRGDTVAIEEPGYPGAHTALTAGGAVLAPIPVDREGIDVAALETLGPQVRAVYVTPSHQYPLGVFMSATRRGALLEWARRARAWIIEDDYDSEYRYVSRPLGALQGMEAGADGDAERRVIYIGTFSKVLFPALRVGYVVVPLPLWDAFAAARDAADLFPSTLYQLALADFLADGRFVRHIRRMRGIYLGRRDALLEGLDRHCRGLLTLDNADAGLHVTTRLPAGADDVDIVRRMDRAGLSGAPLSSCYIGTDPQPGLLLGFGGSREPAIKRATRQLADVLRDALA